MKIFARLVCLLVFSGLGAGIGWAFGPTTVNVDRFRSYEIEEKAQALTGAATGFALLGAIAGAGAGIFLGIVVVEDVK